jgi:HlyD family secretion protein
LEKYKNGESVQLQQTDDLALKKAEYVLDRAKKKLADSDELYKKGFITRLELESDQFDQRQAEMDLEKAKTAVMVTSTYTIRIATEEKKSAVDEARKELERTKSSAEAAEAKGMADVDAKKRDFGLNDDKLKKLVDQKTKARVFAPADGLVVYFREEWDEEPRIKIGAQVVERQRMIELPDTSSMKVALRVHEAKVERLRVGLPASVEIEGFTGQRFTGQISNIAVLAEAQHWSRRDLKEYETDVLLDGVFTDLKPGVTARAEILLTELKNVLAVPVQAVFGKGGKYFVFVDTNGEAAPVEVKVGLSSTEFVEVKEGLTQNQKVRLAVTDEMKVKLPQDVGQVEQPEAKPRRRPATQPAVTAGPTSRPASAPAMDLPTSRPRP